MNRQLAQVTLVVHDYDEAIKFYIEKLNFIIIEDTPLNENKRWVVIRPSAHSGCSLLLAKAVNSEQNKAVGNQTGGRVFLFLYTDDFDRDYRNLVEKGITITREPVIESYGKVAVFSDLYGNLWDLIEPSSQKNV
jgi:uncharacterized glyoxalase superfamily protein PhnB